MTSKLRRTIVGVGIALGGAAPACFGRTDVQGDLPMPSESDDGTPIAPGDGGAPEPKPADAAPPDRRVPSDGSPNVPDATDPSDGSSVPDATDPSDASSVWDATDPSDASSVPDATDPVDASDGAALDAATDAPIDPFCDVWWPPTKGNPISGRVACVDPLDECANVEPPYQCFRLIEPYNCDRRETRVGPLYCIGGEWRCPPGTDDGSRCLCYGPLAPGQTCTDAGPS